MVELDAGPDRVDVFGYAGDTLTIAVTAPDALIAGRDWSAQVRLTRDASDPPAAVFTITEPAVADGPAYLVLPASETTRLVTVAGKRARVRVGTRAAWVMQFVGVWDVQLAPAGGGDPTTTLAHGDLVLELDVTRAAVAR